MSRGFSIFIIALIVAGGLVILAPEASATPINSVYTENFDSQFVGVPPVSANGQYITHVNNACGNVENTLFNSAPNGLTFTTGSTTSCINFEEYGSWCNGATVSFHARTTSSANGNLVFGSNVAVTNGANVAGTWVVNFNINAGWSIQTVDESLTQHGNGPTTNWWVGANWFKITVTGFACDGSNYWSFHAVCETCAPQQLSDLVVQNPLITTPSLQASRVGMSMFSTGGVVVLDDLQVTQNANINAPSAISCRAGAGCDTTVCADGTMCGHLNSDWGSTENIVGFQTDAFGNVVIARTATAAPVNKIRAFNPVGLAEIGATPLANSCTTNGQDGVMAYSQIPPGRYYTGFLDCTSNPTQMNTLSIRGGDLNNPDQANTVCNDFCDFNLVTQGASSDCTTSAAPTTQANQIDPNSRQIGSIASVPISWRQGFNPNGVPKNVYLGFAYTDAISGNIGMWVIKQISNNPDFSCRYEMPFVAGGGTITQMCTMHYTNMTAPSGNDFSGDFVLGGGNSVAGRIWQMTVKNLFADGPTDSFATQVPPSLFMEQVGPSLRTNLIAVGCTNTNDVITMGPDGTIQRTHIFPGSDLTQPNWLNGIPHYPKTAVVGVTPWSGVQGLTGTNRALAVSQEGNWFAYLKDSTHVAIANGTTGAMIGTISLSSLAGGFVGMNMVRNGQGLYIATQGTVAFFDIHLATTGRILCPTCNYDGTTVDSNGAPTTGGGTPPSTGGAGPNVGDFVPIFPGVNSTASRFLWAAITCMAFMAAAYAFTRHNPSVAVIGGAAIIGYIVAIAAFQAPFWPIVVLAIIGLAVVFLRSKIGGSPS